MYFRGYDSLSGFISVDLKMSELSELLEQLDKNSSFSGKLLLVLNHALEEKNGYEYGSEDGNYDEDDLVF